MISRPLLLQCTAVLVVLQFITACGSAPEKNAVNDPEPVTPGNFYVGTKDLYAILKSASGGSWVFGEVTTSGVQVDKGFLVRLNDLAPAFDTRIAECTPQAYPTDHKCNPAHPFRDKDVGVLGKIISGGLAAGTAGKVTDVSRTYKTTFDETRFNQAVDEALVNTGLDNERQEFLSSIEEYATLLDDSYEELEQLQREAEARYRDTSNVRLDIQPDVSGLTEYYTNDLDFADVVTLIPKSAADSEQKAPRAEKLLPCDARHCMQKTRTAIAAIRADVQGSRQRLNTREASGRYSYELRCDKTTYDGYLFTLQCPKQVTALSGDSVPLPVKVEILARDFTALYPSVDLEDGRLRVDITGDEVEFSNLTSDYVSITAQTVYYNSQVQTNAVEINVAPGAVVRRKMRDFVSPAIEIESSYQQMTPDKANGATFQFGFAAQYRVAGETADSTLFETDTFGVGCVIDNRIRPGSCSESPAEDMHTVKQSLTPVPF